MAFCLMPQDSSSAAVAVPTLSANSAPSAAYSTTPAPNHRVETVSSNLYVSGLVPTVADADILQHFGPFGPIVSAKVMLNIHTGISRGIAFVQFEVEEHAVKAREKLDGLILHGAPITVKFADQKAAYNPGRPTNRIFVRNLPIQLTHAAVSEYFSQFGRIEACVFQPDRTGLRHGVASTLNTAYITFGSVDDAKKAAETVHGTKPFAESTIPLLAKVAESEERRVERLRKKHSVDSSTSDTAAPQRGSVVGSNLNGSFNSVQSASMGSSAGAPPTVTVSAAAPSPVIPVVGGYNIPVQQQQPGAADQSKSYGIGSAGPQGQWQQVHQPLQFIPQPMPSQPAVRLIGLPSPANQFAQYPAYNGMQQVAVGVNYPNPNQNASVIAPTVGYEPNVMHQQQYAGVHQFNTQLPSGPVAFVQGPPQPPMTGTYPSAPGAYTFAPMQPPHAYSSHPSLLQQPQYYIISG
jgi:RNA recognition motif-containing protein